MGDCNFCFLKEEYPEIFKHCLEIEDNLALSKGFPSIISCRSITEEFTKEFCKEQNIQVKPGKNKKYVDQFDRLKKLEKEQIFNEEELDTFHKMRLLGNSANHDPLNIEYEMSEAFKAHQLLFEAMVILYSKMDNHENFKKPEYSTKFKSINAQSTVNNINNTTTNNTTNYYFSESGNKIANTQVNNKESKNYIPYIIAIFIVIIACFGIFAYTTFDSGDNNIVSNQFSTQSNDIANPYWASADSDRFHLSSCKWAKKISDSNLITYPDRDAAIADGRIPCGECNP